MKLQNKISLLFLLLCPTIFGQKKEEKQIIYVPKIVALTHKIWSLNQDFESNERIEEPFKIDLEKLLTSYKLVSDSSFSQNQLISAENGMYFVGRLDVRTLVLITDIGHKLELFELNFYNESSLLAVKTFAISSIDGIYSENIFDYKNTSEIAKLDALSPCKFAVNSKIDNSFDIQSSSKNYNVTIYNETGAKLDFFESKEQLINIKSPNLNTGVYVLHLLDKTTNSTCTLRVLMNN
jgi:hypothetical protein